MAKRPPQEIERAIARLSDEYLIPLSEIAGQPFNLNGIVVRPTASVLMRWGIEGKASVWLDVLFQKKRAAWVTSREAIVRFQTAVAAKPAQTPRRDRHTHAGTDRTGATA